MNKITKIQERTFQTEHIMTNDKNNIQALLYSLNESLKKIRSENEYVGETRIMQSLSRKNKTIYYTRPFEEDLDKLIKIRNEQTRKTEQQNNLIIQQIKENSRLRINHPKN